MLSLFSAIFGFMAPFLPEVLKYFNRKQDNAHELAMMEMRLKNASYEHSWRMEEINAQADISEMQVLRKPQQSFGVQLLDAAKPYADKTWGKWLLTPVFYLFSMLDILTGLVRPSITYAAFGFYIAFKWALFTTLTAGNSTEAALLMAWGEQDWGVLVLVISYWFGARTAKAVFGGSTQTSYKGG